MKRLIRLAIVFGCLLLAVPAARSDERPDEARVVRVRLVRRSSSSWDIHVTVLHNDEGWDHYADLWQVLNTADDRLLGERVLLHPHDNEQPFTRSLTNVVLPDDVRQLTIRARCNRHGWGTVRAVVDLPSAGADVNEIILEVDAGSP